MLVCGLVALLFLCARRCYGCCIEHHSNAKIARQGSAAQQESSNEGGADELAHSNANNANRDSLGQQDPGNDGLANTNPPLEEPNCAKCCRLSLNCFTGLSCSITLGITIFLGICLIITGTISGVQVFGKLVRGEGNTSLLSGVLTFVYLVANGIALAFKLN